MTGEIGRWTRRGGLSALLVAMVFLLSPGAAWAGTVSVSVGAPSSAAVGSTVEVQATVTSDGVPVPGAVVALSYHTSFGGVEGPVELARAVTDTSGLASLSYQQRAADNGEMSVDYVGPDEGVTAGAVFSIAVEPGAVQLYRSAAGVSIPWLNATLVIGLIALLWSVIAFSALQLVLVGRGGETAGGGASLRGTSLHGEEGSAWIATALALAALITAIGMVVVFVRSPLTHGNLRDADNYTRAPVSYLGVVYPYGGFGLRDPQLIDTGDPVRDGAALWIGNGCASCHGTAAAGGPVAPDMSDIESLSDLRRKVRKGPELMPSFAVDALSDADLEKIYAWLEAGSPARP